MKKTIKRNQGFTLIELLVVITIIAILASLSAPVFNKVTTNARVTTAINNGRQVMTSLKLYSGDFSGAFPRAEDSSNEALAQLFPTYIDQEKIFHNNGSLFCLPEPPDEDFGQDDETEGVSEKALAAGENQWAYISGYADTDKSTRPILADAFTLEGNAYDENHMWWNVNKAVVVYLDGSAIPEQLVKKGDTSGEIKGKGKYKNDNLFTEDRLGRGKVLNPLKP